MNCEGQGTHCDYFGVYGNVKIKITFSFNRDPFTIKSI